MRAVVVWVVALLLSVCGARYTEPDPEKRVELPEPSCEELRAMWRYTKRQSRAAKTTNGYPISLGYPDVFSYNLWQSYKDRPKPSLTYRGRVTGRPRSRAAGGAPIYGRMVHKAPAGSRLRNGMRHRSRALEDVARLYGTVNRFPPSTRRRLTSFRVGGSPAYPQLPQAGSFLHLKELIRAERARELQEQHMAEEIASKAAFEEPEEEQQPSVQQPRKQFLSPLPPVQIPSKMNYELGQGRYMSGAPIIGQAWSRSGPQTREYMLR